MKGPISEPLEQRVEKLEKAVRELEPSGVVVLSPGRARPKRTVEAEKFVLRDEDGKMRAMLAMTEEGAALVFGDANGEARGKLVITSEGAALVLYDANGKMPARLSITPEGATLVFDDANGKMLARLFMTAEEPGRSEEVLLVGAFIMPWLLLMST